MTTMHRFLVRSTALMLLALAITASAQRAETFDDYEVHYNAIPTGSLNPSVAESYGILRSRTKALVMITVLQDGQPVPASVEIGVRDDREDLRDIPAQRVREDDWVSYIGTFDYEPDESLNFELMVNPHGPGGPYAVRFRQAVPGVD
ncbi:hypothetical protein SPISAL_01585 [Spiribacter salinus M19-40]|uniref:DUF4426 domain-containing protein n=1 Tax=Spiribacter salinus M19-40 TaxID=1260251 RepID=R4VDL1_9GAMM|nr:DUF4426 domain-containing protein [Spiribacter salinus]AGM40416.1 hypothetical protein SPISAL_01585 [Spiribacter salinus M19-40]